MIRLRESEDTRDISLYDVVDYAGYGWYVIDLDSDSVTLLAKDDVFGNSMFAKIGNGNRYRDSIVRQYLNSKVLPALESRGAKPMPVELVDMGCTDKVWLLSVGEAKRLPKNIRSLGNLSGEGQLCGQEDNWWFRSPGHEYDRVAIGSPSGSINFQGSLVFHNCAVRPAMKVKLEDL